MAAPSRMAQQTSLLAYKQPVPALDLSSLLKMEKLINPACRPPFPLYPHPTTHPQENH